LKKTIWSFTQVILLGVLLAGCGGHAGSSRVQVSLNLTVAPTSLDLGSVTVGNASAAQTVTISNNSSGSITVSAITISGPFAYSGAVPPVTLDAGQSSTLNVTFTPTASGAASGTLTITSTAGNSPAMVALAGTGTSPAAGGTPMPAAFWGITVNRLSSYPLQVPYGQFRDALVHQWPNIETCQASSGAPTDPCFGWSGLDTELSDLNQAGINNVFYTLSSTPPWGSQNSSDANCNFYRLGAQFHGACYPPVDLNSDGTGANQIWKNWVTAIATRVNEPAYLQTHAHIKYWEIWNEFYRSTTIENWAPSPGNLSWQGSYNQLVRLAEDARCIITGTGVIHDVPSTGDVSSCTAAAIDPSAVIVAPSTAPSMAAGLDGIQNFLYCNHSPKATCSVGTAGAAVVDIINAHLYATMETPERVASTEIPNLRAVLQSAELAKPLWNGEGSWGALPNANNIWSGDAYARAGFIPRFFALYSSAGVAENFWYSYDINDGQLFDSVAGHLLTPEATAWTTTYHWLVNAVPTQTPFCQTSGAIYFCDFSRVNGYVARLVWDSQFGQNCAQMENPVICGNTTYNVPSQFNRDWVDVVGTVHPASGVVMVGANPILLEGQK
jgi:hypothetical protein